MIADFEKVAKSALLRRVSRRGITVTTVRRNELQPMDRSTRGLPSPLPNASSSLYLSLYPIIDPFIDTERVMRERYRISAKTIAQLSLERERNHL
jgi:hypothetical protein